MFNVFSNTLLPITPNIFAISTGYGPTDARHAISTISPKDVATPGPIGSCTIDRVVISERKNHITKPCASGIDVCDLRRRSITRRTANPSTVSM
jgi:hypothetical protein